MSAQEPQRPQPLLDARVLCVDDELVICRGVQRVLRSLGAKVDLAGNGTEGLARLTEQDFDVAIIDLVMPSLGGLELLERVGQAGMRVVPIVITAHASIETAIEAVQRGAFDYLPKPFVPDELVLRVERALRWRRLRDEAERLLLEVNEDRTQLRAIINSLADGVIIVNMEGDVVLTNPAACEALRGGQCPLEPTPVEEVIADPRLVELILATAAVQRETHPVLGTRLDVEGRSYMARVAPLRRNGGEFIGSATVIRDVTELLSLERAKSQFMSMVAHELKSPLAAVQGFLKVILSQDLPPDKLTELVSRCSDRVDGMSQLVRDLLDLARADVVPLRRVEELEAADLIAEAVELNEPLAERLRVTVQSGVAPDCPPVHADREDIIRLLSNLVSNATKYNRPGGEVRVLARRQGEELRVDVTDTGLGIPEQAIPRLGEEFFRVDTPEHRGIVGTGLGLALVKRVLVTYGGRMEVTSQPGTGSTFTVWLRE